jgi:methylglutaconyl-CoA hydratase
MMADELVHLAVAGGVGTITLDSLANRNALSRQLVADLDRHLATALGDPAVRVIVLTGAGSVFLWRGPQRAPDGRARAAAWTALRSGADPHRDVGGAEADVGRINGAARRRLGLGAACDLAVAAEATTFALSVVRIGVIPAIIAVVLVPKIGEARTMELCLTGDVFDARAAAGYGLLNAAAPEGRLDEVVDRYVASLLKGAPTALAGCKRAVRDIPKLSMYAAFAEMSERSMRSFASDEAREGMTAFAEKRPPRWAASD